jgi:hypothetical protein
MSRRRIPVLKPTAATAAPEAGAAVGDVQEPGHARKSLSPTLYLLPPRQARGSRGLRCRPGAAAVIAGRFRRGR